MFDASTAVTDLLARVEHFPAKKRDREVTSLARGLSAPEAAAVVAELEERGGLYAQRLAGLVAVSSRNVEWITKAIADTDANKHRVAIGASIRHPDRVPIPDEVYEAALHDAPQVRRRLILRSLQGRPQLADRLFDRVRADWGEEAAQWVFPSCSDSFVRARLLDVVKHVNWDVLMKRHTLAVIDVLRERLDSSGNESCNDLNTALRNVPKKSTRQRAEYYVKLLESHPKLPFPCDRLPFELLLRSDPDDLLNRLCGKNGGGFHHVTRKQLKKLRRAKSPVFDKYIGVNPVDSNRFQWYLSNIPESQRRQAFTRALAKGAEFNYLQDMTLLDWIPLDEAAKIVRPLINDDLKYDTTLRLKKFLPPAEVREDFLEATRRPDANERAVAWEMFASNVVLQDDPAQLTEFLALFRDRTAKERPEVRSTISQRVMSIPARLFSPESLPILAELHRQDETAELYPYGYTRVAAMLIKEHPTDTQYVNWAVDFLQNAHDVEEDKDPWRRRSLVYMGHGLSLQDAARFHEILRPHLETAVERQQYSLLYDVVSSLGPRGVPIRELYNQLWEAFKNGKVYQAGEALSLWLKPSKTSAKRLGRALDADASIIHRYDVSSAVATQRTDLLDRAFEKTHVGRFRKCTKSWVLNVYSDPPYTIINHWTASQMRAYAEQIQRFASDASAHRVKVRAEVITTFAFISGGAEYATKWIDSDKTKLAEAGLTGLAGSQAHVPILLSHGTDDKAHVAAPALFMGLRRMPLSQVEDVVSNMLTSKGNKVVMRKQALRYASWFLTRGKYIDFILSVMKNKDTHRDIRVLCVSIIVENLLREPGAWEVVRNATLDEDENVRKATIVSHDQLPSDLTKEELATYAEFVVSLLDSPHRDLVKLAIQHVAEYVPLSPTLNAQRDPPVLRRLAQMMIGDLQEYCPLMGVETQWRSATLALVQLSKYGTDALHDAMTTLISQRTTPEDRLIYNRVRDITNEFVNERSKSGDAMRMFAALLEPHAEYRPLTARLCLLAPPPEKSFTSGPALVAHLDAVASLCRSNQILVTLLLTELKPLLKDQKGKAFLDAAEQLAERADFTSGMFACTIAQLLGAKGHSAAPWQSLVEQLRKHPVEDVRMVAWAIRTEDKTARWDRLDAASRRNGGGGLKESRTRCDKTDSAVGGLSGIRYPWQA